MTKRQPKPSQYVYGELISNIQNGSIKIPQFQRDFVWGKEKVIALLDSILKGYPIGTFILWETTERLKSVRNLGNQDFPDTEEGYPVKYVLDGQQRMTSLYVAANGLVVNDVDYESIYVDLKASIDEQIVVGDIEGRDSASLMKFCDLCKNDFLINKRYENNWNKLSDYQTAIKTYQFSTVIVRDTPLDVATEIFTRINVSGKPLTLFEIMVARTYDEKKKFDLSEKYDELLEDLKICRYETISKSAILQTVAVCLTKECTAKQILRIEKNKFIDTWDSVICAIKTAIDYLRSSFLIPVSQLLPYDAEIVPFAYYFYKHKNSPVGDQENFLKDYFWRVALTSRFSNALESKIAQDIKKIDIILCGKHPDYDEPIDISLKGLEDNGEFSTGSAYIKGMLCILAAQHPKSFEGDKEVIIDNNWLRKSSSKNYHHFFPKAYMRKNYPKTDERLVNHIANITIIDDFLNKQRIKDRAPSDYISEFMTNNQTLVESLKTHLIGNPEDVGILSNDYETFRHKRLKEFQKELKKRVILTARDRI